MHKDVTITFGNSNYKNLMFKGKFDEGKCLSGKIFISDEQGFEGVITKEDNFTFKFLFQEELHDDDHSIFVYYETSENEIVKKTFDKFGIGQRFFNHAEKKMSGSTLLLAKTMIVGRK